MTHIVEHRRVGLGELLEEWVRDGNAGWLLIHHPECDVYLPHAKDDDCDCCPGWIGPFGRGFKA